MNTDFNSIGKWLIILGIVIIIAGIILLLFNKIPFFGKLPGDILVQKKTTFYFPVVTSIVISVVLSLIFYLINKFRQ